jgi:flavodoxin
MKTGIIYYSLSGKTRSVVEKLHGTLEGDLIEVSVNPPYSTLSAVTKGCYRALKGSADEVLPDQIDISGYDRVVFATPVWAGRSTPAIHGAINNLHGFQGKSTFLICTCGDAKSGEQALSQLKSLLEEKGMKVAGSVILDKKKVIDGGTIAAIPHMIEKTGDL